MKGKVYIIDDLLDVSVSDYFWENDHLLYFVSTVLGLNKIFTVDIITPTKPNFKMIDTKSTTASFGLPIKALKKRDIKEKNIILDLYYYKTKISYFMNTMKEN